MFMTFAQCLGVSTKAKGAVRDRFKAFQSAPSCLYLEPSNCADWMYSCRLPPSKMEVVRCLEFAQKARERLGEEGVMRSLCCGLGWSGDGRGAGGGDNGLGTTSKAPKMSQVVLGGLCSLRPLLFRKACEDHVMHGSC